MKSLIQEFFLAGPGVRTSEFFEEVEIFGQRMTYSKPEPNSQYQNFRLLIKNTHLSSRRTLCLSSVNFRKGKINQSIFYVFRETSSLDCGATITFLQCD